MLLVLVFRLNCSRNPPAVRSESDVDLIAIMPLVLMISSNFSQKFADASPLNYSFIATVDVPMSDDDGNER